MQNYHAVFFTDICNTTLVYKPLGAYKVASVLREHGYNVLVVDHLHCWKIQEMKQLLDNCISDHTLVLGFSTTFFQDTNVPDSPSGKIYGILDNSVSVCPQGEEYEVAMLDHARKLNPKIKILAGGGNDTRETFANPRFDFAMVGYSENSIVNLMRHLAGGEDLRHARKNPAGICVVDDRLAAGYDFQKDHMVWQPTDVIGARVLPIECARGCVFNCKFCRYPMRNKKRMDFVRSTESISRELQENYDRYGIRHYMISDDTFNDNEDKLRQIRDAVQKLTFEPCMWTYTRLDILSVRKDRADLMYDIGVRSMFFGIETLTERVGRIIGKAYDREQQIKMIQYIKRRWGDQIQLHGNFIYGLPTESHAEIDVTVSQLRSGDIALDSWGWNHLILALDSGHAWNAELAKNYERYGYSRLPEAVPANPGLHHLNEWDTNAINWQNEHMDFQTARRRVSEIMTEYHATPRPIGGMMTMGLINYPDWDWQRGIKTRNTDMQWDRVTAARYIFVQKYKQRLLELLTK